MIDAIVAIFPPKHTLYYNHGLINYIDTKAKCRHTKKLTWKGTLRQVFITYQSLYKLEIQSVNHVGIFDAARPPQTKTLEGRGQTDKVPLQVNFLDDILLWCLYS